jgi:hypothetical protein
MKSTAHIAWPFVAILIATPAAAQSTEPPGTRLEILVQTAKSGGLGLPVDSAKAFAAAKCAAERNGFRAFALSPLKEAVSYKAETAYLEREIIIGTDRGGFSVIHSGLSAINFAHDHPFSDVFENKIAFVPTTQNLGSPMAVLALRHTMRMQMDRSPFANYEIEMRFWGKNGDEDKVYRGRTIQEILDQEGPNSQPDRFFKALRACGLLGLMY